MTMHSEDPRQRRRDARIAEILEAAWRLADRDGLGAISLRDLAASVGLRQPSLYVYFDSKLALYDAMFADGFQQLLSTIDERDYDGDARDALVDFVRDLLLFSSASVVRHQMLFQRTLPGFDPSPEAYAYSQEFSRRALALFERAGVTDPGDLDLCTALIAGMTHQQVANDPGGRRWADQTERAVDMLLAAAAHQPAGAPSRPSTRTR